MKTDRCLFGFLIFLVVVLVLSCNEDGRGLRSCCNQRIDGNVNNLPPPADGNPLEDIVAFNVITPNGDGLNEFFFVQGLYLYPNNTVEIFDSNNRSIFFAEGYNSSDIRFPQGDVKQGAYRYKIVIDNEDVFLLQGYLCVVTGLENNFEFDLGCNVLDLGDPALQ